MTASVRVTCRRSERLNNFTSTRRECLAVKNIKCTLNTFCLPVNTLNVLKKLFKLAMTDMCSFKRKLLELNEREAVKSAWTDHATLYRIRAGIVVHDRHAQFACRLVQFAVRL